MRSNHVLMHVFDAQSFQAQEEEEARVLAEFEATFGAKGDDAERKPQVRKAVGRFPCSQKISRCSCCIARVLIMAICRRPPPAADRHGHGHLQTCRNASERTARHGVKMGCKFGPYCCNSTCSGTMPAPVVLSLSKFLCGTTLAVPVNSLLRCLTDSMMIYPAALHGVPTFICLTSSC